MSTYQRLVLLADNQSCVIDNQLNRENLSAHWDLLFQRDYVSASIYSLIFLTGTLLNLYIIVVLISKKYYTQPTFLMLLNLNFSDLFMCLIIVLYIIITRFAGQSSFGPTDYIRCQICKIGIVFNFLGFTSSFIIALLAIDRLIFFRAPLRYEKYINTRRTMFALGIIWGASFVISIPPLVGYGDLIFFIVCGPIFATPQHIMRSIVYVALTGPLLVAVMVILIVTNTWILIIAARVVNKKKATKVHPDSSTTSHLTESANKLRKRVNYQRAAWSKMTAKKQIRFFQVFVALLIVNTVLFVPVLALVVTVIFTSNISPIFLDFVQIFMLSQTTLRPLTQVLLTPELRRLLLKPCRPPKKSTLEKYWKALGEFCAGCCTNDAWMKELESQLRKRPESYSSFVINNTSTYTYNLNTSVDQGTL